MKSVLLILHFFSKLYIQPNYTFHVKFFEYHLPICRSQWSSAIDMFHVFVLAYPPLMTSHSGNGLSKKCPGDLEEIRASP